jgi:hypothetical protein
MNPVKIITPIIEDLATNYLNKINVTLNVVISTLRHRRRKAAFTESYIQNRELMLSLINLLNHNSSEIQARTMNIFTQIQINLEQTIDEMPREEAHGPTEEEPANQRIVSSIRLIANDLSYALA